MKVISIFLVKCLGLYLCILWGLRAEQDYTDPYNFVLYAGDSSVGSRDGVGGEARFNGPLGVATDMAGNIYVADERNQVIRKITPEGVVSTLAGAAGYAGYVDGQTSEARFRLPKDVVVDAMGNVLVADAGNRVIRKITPSGAVSTLAGSGQSGSQDGSAHSASFGLPTGLALSGDGSIYVADAVNNKIRKIEPSGMVSTFAGSGAYGKADGMGTEASFFYPISVAVDAGGYIYVAEAGNNLIRKIAPNAQVTTLDSGSGDAAVIRPAALEAAADGTLYIADASYVLKVAASGSISVLAGKKSDYDYKDGVGGEARFLYPGGIALDSEDSLIVGDRDDNTIRKISSEGAVSTLAGYSSVLSRGSVDGTGAAVRFYGPTQIAVDSGGNLYVADTGNNTIRKVSVDGTVSTVAGIAGREGLRDEQTGQALFSEPTGIAVDETGNIYVSSTGDSTIRKILPSGVVELIAGRPKIIGATDGSAAESTFNYPRDLVLGADGSIYVADTRNHTIRKITPGGVVSTLAGQAGESGMVDGKGSAARLSEPSSLAIDSSGNLYVGDVGNGRIRKISSSGEVTSLTGFGGWNSDPYGDGPAAKASLSLTMGMDVDGQGNIYVTQFMAQTVRRISSDGNVTTVGGLVEASGSSSGVGKNARFAAPRGIAVQKNGTLYVASSSPSSNVLFKGRLEGAPLISSQPVGMEVSAGADVVFSVSATGNDPLSYQWFFNGNAISAATNSSYTVSDAGAGDAGEYSVQVSNHLGSDTSSKAVLSLKTSPPPTSSGGTGGSSGGGGGGSPSGVFLSLLTGLTLIRWLVQRRK